MGYPRRSFARTEQLSAKKCHFKVFREGNTVGDDLTVATLSTTGTSKRISEWRVPPVFHSTLRLPAVEAGNSVIGPESLEPEWIGHRQSPRSKTLEFLEQAAEAGDLTGRGVEHFHERPPAVGIEAESGPVR